MVARIAGRRRTRVAAGMATVAGDRRVCPGEREPGLIVIKRCRRPATSCVALFAERGETCCHMIRITHTSVVAVMAGIARRRRAGVSGGMTTVTCHRGMRSRERESTQIVIE